MISRRDFFKLSAAAGVGLAVGANTLRVRPVFAAPLIPGLSDPVIQPKFVNLAPNTNVKLLSNTLRGTRLGVALLESDYRLKRLSASLLHPDLETGQSFWSEVVARYRVDLGTDEVPLVAFQRVWIVPDIAVVYEGTRESLDHFKSGQPELRNRCHR